MKKPFSINDFKIRTFHNRHGTLKYMVDGYYREGERVRKAFSTREAAEEELEKIRLAEEAFRSEEMRTRRQTILNPIQLSFAEQAFVELGVLTPPASPPSPSMILDAVRLYVREQQREKKLQHIPLLKALDEFAPPLKNAAGNPLPRKANDDRSDRTIENLRQRVSHFIDSSKVALVSDITHEHIDQWINRVGQRARETVRSDRRVLFTFFAWCVLHHYCETNPVEDVAMPRPLPRRPETIPLESVKAMLAAAQTHKCLPYLVFGLFAGIRPNEISSLTWDLVKLDTAVIRLDAEKTKVRARRVVELDSNAVAWLRYCHGQPIRASRRTLDAVKRAAGFVGRAKRSKSPSEERRAKLATLDSGLKPFPADGIRHTALSNHYAYHENEGRTARWAGNSPEIVHTHYKGLTTHAEAKAFWSLMPPGHQHKPIPAGAGIFGGAKVGRAKRSTPKSVVRHLDKRQLRH